MSVEEKYDPNWSPGAGMPCGRLGMCREPVDSADTIFYIDRHGILCPGGM